MNTKTMLAVVAIATGLVSRAADYTFTGGAGSGDISAAENWGGTLPGSDDTATIDGSTAGRNDFTRSGSFSVGAFSLLNWTNAMLLDLNEGAISASALTIGGAGPVVISNGTLSVSGKVTVNAASVLKVAKGATVSLPDSVTLGNELLVAKATLKNNYYTYPPKQSGTTFPCYNMAHGHWQET